MLDGGRNVGRIYRVTDHPDSPWFWGVTRRKSTESTREKAMAAFKAEYERWLEEQPKA